MFYPDKTCREDIRARYIDALRTHQLAQRERGLGHEGNPSKLSNRLPSSSLLGHVFMGLVGVGLP